MLSNRDKDLVKSLYGIEKNAIPIKELIEKHGISNTMSAYRMLTVAHKKVEDYLKLNKPIVNYSDKRNNNQNKLYNKYSQEEINQALLKLTPRNKEIFEYYYGVNGKSIINSVELASRYNLKLNSLYSLIRRIETQIEGFIKNPVIITDEQRKYQRLLEKYDAQRINSIIESFEPDEKEKIQAYYGLIQKDNLDMSEINSILKRFKKRLDNQEEKKNVRIQLLLDKYLGYDIDILTDVINSLDSKYKDVLVRYYGISGYSQMQYNDIANDLNISIDEIRYIIRHQKRKIIEKLEVLKKDDILTKFQLAAIASKTAVSRDIYPILANYKREDILISIESLDDKEKEIIKLYFGIETNSISINAIANKYNESYCHIKHIITQTTQKIINILNSSEYDLDEESMILKKEKEYLNLFLWHNDMEMNSVVNNLDLKDQHIFRDYYGIDGCTYTLKDISNKYKLEENEVKLKISRLRNLLESQLSKYKASKYAKRTRVIQSSKKKCDEQIINIITGLTKNEKNLLYYYYGLNGYKKVVVSKLCAGLNVSKEVLTITVNKLIEKINSQIETPNETELVKETPKRK